MDHARKVISIQVETGSLQNPFLKRSKGGSRQGFCRPWNGPGRLSCFARPERDHSS